MEYWQVDLLDSQDHAKGRFPQVAGGSLDWSIFKAIGGSGKIEFTDKPDFSVNWFTDRLAITHVNESAAQPIQPMGIWLFAKPEKNYKQGITKAPLALLDKCELYSSEIGQWLTIPAGTVVTDKVYELLTTKAVGVSVSLTASTKTLSIALSWEPTDTWLTVINGLLKAIDYGSLWVDLLGRFRVAPYILPEKRPIRVTYGSAPGNLKLRDEWDDSLPLSDIPTGVVAFSKGDENTAGLRARVDLPDNHPLSAVSRGREKIKSINVEAVDQAAIDGLAARGLAEAVQAIRRSTILHPVNATEMNEVVRHGPLNYHGPIVERNVTLGLGAVVKDTIRRIYTEDDDLPWL